MVSWCTYRAHNGLAFLKDILNKFVLLVSMKTPQIIITFGHGLILYSYSMWNQEQMYLQSVNLHLGQLKNIVSLCHFLLMNVPTGYPQFHKSAFMFVKVAIDIIENKE